MKRRILIVTSISYIVLIVIILVIGIDIRSREALLITETFEADSTTTKTPGEDGRQISKTAIINTITQTVIETLSATIETPLLPSPEPTKTPTLTETIETPTQVQVTSTVSPPTATTPAYPINGDGTATTTPPSYPVDDAANETFTPTSTTMPTLTPTTQTGWIGDWEISWEQPDGSYLSGLMTVNIDGFEISSSIMMGEDQFIFDGILNESQVTAVGTWTESSNSGDFYWHFVQTGQFVGNLDRQYGICGSREGTELPDTCLEIPSDK